MKLAGTFICAGMLIALSLESDKAYAQSRFEVGVQTPPILHLRSFKDQPRKALPGIGVRIGYDLNDHVTLEMVVNSFFRNSEIADGWKSQWLWGAKVGQRFRRFGLFTKARIGLLNFDRDFLASSDGSAATVARLDQANFTATWVASSRFIPRRGIAWLSASKWATCSFDSELERA